MEPIKPGTQCECHHRFDGESGLIRNGHEYAHRINEYSLNEHCTRDAVRMVIVENDNIGDDWIKHGLTGIPMCAACAEWHEKGAREGSPLMRRLFVIIPLWLLLMTLALIVYRAIPPSEQAQINELRERVQTLEKHLDAAGQ